MMISVSPLLSSRKKRFGRATRLRRKKTTDSAVVDSSVSSNLFCRKLEHISLRMIEIVTAQLGYKPTSIVDVIATKKIDEEKYPIVIALYPLNINELGGRYDSLRPFPTCIWMSCPILHSRISKLEDLGWVKRLEDRLANGEQSEIWIGQMLRAHELYSQYRWGLLSDEDKRFVVDQGWEKSLRNVGIAGIQNLASVKCLHTHYAHFISMPEHGNIIGQWVDELLVNIPDGPVDIYKNYLGDSWNI